MLHIRSHLPQLEIHLFRSECFKQVKIFRQNRWLLYRFKINHCNRSVHSAMFLSQFRKETVLLMNSWLNPSMYRISTPCHGPPSERSSVWVFLWCPSCRSLLQMTGLKPLFFYPLSGAHCLCPTNLAPSASCFPLVGIWAVVGLYWHAGVAASASPPWLACLQLISSCLWKPALCFRANRKQLDASPCASCTCF